MLLYHQFLKKSHIYSKLAFVVSLTLLLSSCIKDELRTTTEEEGKCEVIIKLYMESFGLDGRDSTRSYVEGNEDENRINNIWVFQYNAETGTSLHDPVYIDNDKLDSNDIEIDLTLNGNGEQSLVCIVANIGAEYADDGSTWALDEYGKIKESFETYDKLLTTALPSSVPSSFLSSNMGEDGYVIPMFGVSKAIAIVSKSYVSVRLVRMLARVDINVDPSYYAEAGMTIDKMRLCNIPNYCRVGTLASDDNFEKAADYPSETQWEDIDVGTTTEFIVYLPENLQGIVAGMLGKNETVETPIPEHALCVELTMTYDEGTKTHTYKVYPGLDMESDFNVLRNYIYKVSIKINKQPE